MASAIERQTARGAETRAWRRWAVVLVPGVILYFIPVAGLSAAQAHLLGIFIATIVALVAQPAPMGVSVVIAMTLLALTRTLPPAKVLSGFSNITVWMVFAAFLFARAVTATGFGKRVGYLIIRRFAHSPLSLGYSIAAADLLLAPFIPSDTSRGGGVIYPVARSVAEDFGSEPGPTAGIIGAYLMLVAFSATYMSSAMFLTSMAANPLIAELARNIAHVDLTWGRWIAGSIVPGLLSMVFVPWLLLHMVRPEVRDTAGARRFAAAELKRMGPLGRDEKWLIAIMLAVMAGWIGSPWHGVSNTFVALAGLCAILLTKVLSWQEMLSETRAWDALVWFAVLIMMSDEMNETGVIGVLSRRMFGAMHGWPWQLTCIALVAAYLYIHYCFAGMTAHITALYPGFLMAALAGGVPPMLAALSLAYFSNLNAGITHYGTGSAPVYFGAGYVRQSQWWMVGFVISVVNLAIWMGIGWWWWKLIGLW